MKRIICTLVALLGLAVLSPVHAQSWPSRPVTLVVAWPPGSGIDVMARIMLDALRTELGQPVVVDNKGGAAGSIGAQLVANANPDGYTLLFTSSALNMVDAMGTKTGFRPQDFVPIANVTFTPSLLIAHPSLNVKTPQELIALAKSKPGELFYATAGNGSPSHFVTELFRVRTGIQATGIPYRGSPEAMADQIAGRVHFSVANSSTALPQVRKGAVVPLAVTGAQRLPAMPDIPTLSEAGLKDFAAASYWNGLLGPKGLPEAVAQRMASAVNAALAKPEVREKLLPTGNEIDGKSTPASFAALIKQDHAIWSDVAKAANIKAQN
ncbi:MAG TPA: tripartite tricarboxylate transporter substrate binding protein [Burkholderiales bacterium]|nr:tripartite tricarboxylate transporter substrate binding protein [Burkholderiales bacterium]